uniref:Uncharacterized protein n=1 Tax=Acrobeloides nanus TaxID=290746 RepID=A0A914DV88_9BILA
MFVIGCLLLAIGLLLWLTFFPKILRNNIEKKKVVQINSDGSLNEFTDEWLNNNYAVKYQYWFYNYSNTWDIVDHGTNPDVFEKGPYTYIEHTTYNYSKDIFSNYDHNFTYYKTTKYIFDYAHSCKGCTEDDVFMLPDLAFFELADIILNRDNLCQMLSESNFTAFPGRCNDTYTPPFVDELSEYFSSFVYLHGGSPFISLKVHEILWDGYQDPIFDQLMVGMKKDMPNLFNLIQNHSNINLAVTPLVTLNKTPKNSLDYTIHTGKDAWNQVGAMALYNGSSQLPKDWWNGYDTNSIYCSSENAAMASKIYGTNGDFFQPQINKTSILSAFVEDMCRSLNFVYKNETQNTGTILAAQKLLQLNLVAKNYPRSGFANIPPGIYPLVWINESYMVDEKTYNNLKTDLINPQNLVKKLCLILGVGLGSAMIILSIVSCFVNICYFTKREPPRLNQNNITSIHEELYPPVYPNHQSDDMQIQQRIRPKTSSLESN